MTVSTANTSGSFSGFNLHLRFTASAGLSGIDIETTEAGTLSQLDSSPTCALGTPPGRANERIYACITDNGTATSAAGALATFTFAAQGNGCITAGLVDEKPIVNGQLSQVVGSYTVSPILANAPLPQRMLNNVTTGAQQILIGTGTATDCPASP